MLQTKLTALDWDEIYYALEVKALSIESGDYDFVPEEVSSPGSETFRWANHLRRIMGKSAIAKNREVDTKNYGVYVRSSDAHAWQLEQITNREMAYIAADANANFHMQTLIIGPFSTFPKWLES
jgi:hypothetical protein